MLFIALDATNEKLEGKLGEATVTTEPTFTTAWGDDSSNGSSLNTGGTEIAASGVTAVDLSGSPGAGVRRDITDGTFYNGDSVIHTVILQKNKGGTVYPMGSALIGPGESCRYEEIISSSANAYPISPALATILTNNGDMLIRDHTGAITRLPKGAVGLSLIENANQDPAWAAVTGTMVLASSAEIDTGTEAGKAIAPSQFVASKRNIRHVPIRLADSATAFVTGTTVGGDWRLPTVTGTIIDCGAYTDTAGVTGTAVIDIHKNGTTIMTTNKISIASAQKSSEDGGATQPTITAGGYAPNDVLTVDKDASHGFPALGLVVWVDLRES